MMRNSLARRHRLRNSPARRHRLRTLVMVVAVSCCTPAWGETQTTVERSLRKLPVGQRLEVTTSKRVYQLQLVDPVTGETTCRVSTDRGRSFSTPQRMYVVGATPGRQAGEMLFVKSGVIRTQMRMELGLGSLARRDRALSETVLRVVLK